MSILEARQVACDELFTNEAEEYKLYEALKFLMLNRAIELYEDREKGKEVPFFSVLLFARDTSNNPEQLLRNHLNHVGHTGGLEQVCCSPGSPLALTGSLAVVVGWVAEELTGIVTDLSVPQAQEGLGNLLVMGLAHLSFDCEQEALGSWVVSEKAQSLAVRILRVSSWFGGQLRPDSDPQSGYGSTLD